MNLTVTPRAAEELKSAVQTREESTPTTVRVMVQSQCGCGSTHFAMGFDEPDEADNTIDLEGVTLLVDPYSAPFLENAQVDYTDDLVGRGFTINTPNSSGCGCGGGGHHH